jgi:hypothetical protein
MALATFADIAVPQVRLTRDPNTILFFLDHLDDAPTFRLENETSWNTNVEDAHLLGRQVVETDQEMYGRSKNARTFVVISDGQVWSGNVLRAITAAAQRNVSVDVIGVGTSNGGSFRCRAMTKAWCWRASSRSGRFWIANRFARSRAAGNGEYFENRTLQPTSRSRRASFRTPRADRATNRSRSVGRALLVSAGRCAGCVGVGLLFVKQRVQARLGLRRRAGAARARVEPALVKDVPGD